MDSAWFLRDVAELKLWRALGVVLWSFIGTTILVRRRRRRIRV